MSAHRPAARTWSFPRPLIEDNIGFLLMLWGGFVAVVIAITLGIAWFGELTQSILDPASEAALWGLAILGGVLVYSYLPLYIANGRTRKSAAIEGGIFLFVYGIAAAVLMTVSYLIEDVLYRIGGWPREFESEHLFTSHLQSHLVFSEYAILFLVAAFVGAFVVAGFYRSDDWGWPLLILGLLVVGVVSTVIGGSFVWPFGFVAAFLDIGTLSPPAGLILSVVALVVSAGVGWLVVRDIPMQTKSS